MLLYTIDYFTHQCGYYETVIVLARFATAFTGPQYSSCIRHQLLSRQRLLLLVDRLFRDHAFYCTALPQLHILLIKLHVLAPSTDKARHKNATKRHRHN